MQSYDFNTFAYIHSNGDLERHNKVLSMDNTIGNSIGNTIGNKKTG